MENSLNTAYDDAFRTMIEKCDDLVFPMLNYMFGEHYSDGDQIIRGSNEEFSQQDGGRLKKRITDSQLVILSGGERKRYHIECESSTKAEGVLVRIFEYGSQIALDDAILSCDEFRLVVNYPRAGVLFLRNSTNVPDKMTIEIRTPDGKTCDYSVSVIRENDFTLDDMFDKELYFLLPFYLFQYEDELPRLNADQVYLQSLLDEYDGIADRLNELVEAGKLSSRSRYVIIQMIKRVSDKLAMAQEHVRQKVGDVMGGHVIDLDIFQAEDKAKAEGKAEGIILFIEDKREDGIGEDIIKQKLIKHFKLTNDEADAYLKKETDKVVVG